MAALVKALNEINEGFKTIKIPSTNNRNKHGRMIFHSNISLKIPTFLITRSSEKMNPTGKKKFELPHHLGNVRSLIADVKLNESLAGGGMEQRAEILMSSDYYPFGMTIGETHVESEAYRYGFNGMEQDDELKGSGNSYDFGARIYDSRVGRFLSLDPLMADNPTWSSYAFAIDNPVMFIDVNGEWPGVTYFYGQLDIGGGIAWGLNYVEQVGVAYDEVGKTHFVMTSELWVFNQSMEGGRRNNNPQIVGGLSASLSAGSTQDWSHETFLGDITNYNGEFGGIGAFGPAGGEISFGEDRFPYKFGFGFGIKLSVINTSIKESISLTDKEAEIVNDATNVLMEIWTINGSKEMKDDKGNVIGFSATVATRNASGELVGTGIQVFSGVTTNSDGTVQSNGVFISEAYETDAEAAETP